MNKNKQETPYVPDPVEAVELVEEIKQSAKRTKKYIFPDIDGGGPSVTIEATSIEEATALFRKGQAKA